MSKNTPTTNTGPTQLNLVSSSRLQALCNKSAISDDANTQKRPFGKSANQEKQQDAELAWLKQLIDQQLSVILAQFPANKQRSLFKIRFGISLDELKYLPIKQVAEILKINPVRR